MQPYSPYHLPSLILLCCSQDHPFNLAGHDFWVMDASDSQEPSGVRDDYLRRDSITVPAGGWIRLRFVSDNPGIWCDFLYITCASSLNLY